ncbi:carbohydrate ABC transporter permease [uncultured Tateyamaria sp.]|uniref:carbohydrate ABC transporter permease n=1 Tax=uncultured Tateyamaria sp. TaxID=455651 RepID=UPI002612BE21|nr:carbohydrate ABC transporter permease [uncultured Tateyamaria sp.]
MDTPRLNRTILALYGFVGLFSMIILLPMLYMIMVGFKSKSSMFLDPLGWPDSLSLDAFERAWGVGIASFLLNSLMVTFLSVVVIVVVSGMAAYALVRMEGRIGKFIYLLIVAGFAIPMQAVLVPLFQIISGAGMLNDRLAIVLPYAGYGIPFTVILFYAFLLDFPKELEEAARLDGCSRFQTFIRVILPLSGPAIASAAIFQSVFIWNEFILALMTLTSPEVKTLPVGILQLRGEYSADWPAMMAGLTLATLPLLLIFTFAQKYFVRSLAGLGK